MATSVDRTCGLHQFSPKDFQEDSTIFLTDHDVKHIASLRLPDENNFKILKTTVVSVDGTNGYLGQYYNIRVTVKLEDSSIKKLNFFAKTPPAKESPQYNYIVKFDVFNKEILFYTDVIRRMGTGTGFKWYPECYLCKKDSIIVLENAKLDGYDIMDKLIPYDEEHCIWVTKALSKFHSRSLILEEKLRCTGQTILDLYGHYLNEIIFTKDEFSIKGMKAAIYGISAMIDLVDSLNDQEKMLFKKRINTWSWALPDILKSSTKHRNTFCHRDIWANNIMFKHDSNGKPIGCYLIDFQLTRYCPPAMDFVACLYLTTDRVTRDRYFKPLMKIYHDTMKRSLEEEGLNVDECLSWTAFRDSCYEIKPIALFYALVNLQIMLMPPQAVEQFMESHDQFEVAIYSEQRTELVRRQCQLVEPYKNRLKEIVIETYEVLPDQPIFI